MSHSGHNVAEKAVHHPLLDGEVDYCLIVTVIDAGELGLVGLLFHDLHLLDDLRGNILGRKLRIVKEESLAVDCYLADCLTVRSDGSILGDLHSRKFFQQVLKDIVFCRLERRGVIFNGIFLYHNRVTGGGDACGVQHLFVRIHLQCSKIQLSLDLDILGQRLVTKEFRLQDIFTSGDFLKYRLSLVVTQGILVGFCIARFCD